MMFMVGDVAQAVEHLPDLASVKLVQTPVLLKKKKKRLLVS
jgi:hypothetical protein